MASKKTEKTSTKSKKAPAKKAPAKKAAAPKAAKEKREPQVKLPRHPRARVVAAHKTKEDLAKAIAASLVRDDEDSDVLAARLKTASNQQLLRLHGVVAQVKDKYGSRDGLIEAIGKAHNKSKDKDYLSKLASYSLPQLLDLAKTADRAARA
jgi:hypothetical protein